MSVQLKIASVKRAWKLSSRVYLEDGREVFLPNEKVEQGFVSEEELFYSEEDQLWEDISFKPVPRKVVIRPKVRDMSKFKSKEEYNLIRNLILKKRALLDEAFVFANLEDLTQDIFVSLWESGYFEEFDEKLGYGYAGYIARAVEFRLIDMVRDPSFQNRQVEWSLNYQYDVEDEESAEFGEDVGDQTIPSPDVEYEVAELTERFREIAKEMGMSNIPEVSYLELFEYLLDKGSVPQFARDHQISYARINKEVDFFRDQLQAEYQANWVSA